MINIQTTGGISESPDVKFQMNKQEIVKECNNNSIIKQLLHDIDGVNYIDGDVVRTKFGSTQIDNIQTGQKAVILQLLNKQYIIDAFDIGGNIFKWMYEHDNIDFNIKQHGGLTQIPDGVSVSIDGKYYSDRRKIVNKIFGR